MPNPLTIERDGDRFRFSLTLTDVAAVPEDAARLSEALSPFLEDMKTGSFAATAVHTAIEELLTNLGKFGRTGPDAPPEAEALTAEGEVGVRSGCVELRLTDNGREFDPTRQPAPIFTDDPEELVPGGLGLHMLRNMFSLFSHQRIDGKNVSVWSVRAEGKENF